MAGALDGLEVFIGEWSMEARLPGNQPGGPRGRTVFEWLPGRRFLIQRWEVPHPDAPDGLAIIGPDPEREAHVQHYYDSRVVELTPGSRLVGVRLRPGASGALLGLPACELRDLTPALDAGYADQAHMTAEATPLAGLSPVGFLKDRTPTAA